MLARLLSHSKHPFAYIEDSPPMPPVESSSPGQGSPYPIGVNLIPMGEVASFHRYRAVCPVSVNLPHRKSPRASIPELRQSSSPAQLPGVKLGLSLLAPASGSSTWPPSISNRTALNGASDSISSSRRASRNLPMVPS